MVKHFSGLTIAVGLSVEPVVSIFLPNSGDELNDTTQNFLFFVIDTT